MDTKNSSFIYSAKIGGFGRVMFWKSPETNTYHFTFFNGEEYIPISLSSEAVYYVWAFLACEHQDCSISIFTPPKKAGKGKPKKRPSKQPTKKKAKSK